MAYIYKITNDINQKIYIGKTEFSIEKRFREHCQDSQKKTEEHRPLYAAMRKYGIEHFNIELLEETDNPEEREIFWIEQLGSFKNGYNATMGGDGKKYIDYDLVVNTYLQTKNAIKTANIIGINSSSVYNILRCRNIPCMWDRKLQAKENQEKYGKKCALINDSNEIIQIFPSLSEAARFVINNKLSSDNKISSIGNHISKVCSGKQKTAYKHKWKFI